MKDRVTEEVTQMGLRKHGIGEILPEEDQELLKKAKTDWTPEDQEALDDENSK